jgi:hypothetical protein
VRNELWDLRIRSYGCSLIRNRCVFILFRFFNDFAFIEFCSICYFEFFNSVLTKIVEIDSRFFRIFYFKKFQNFNFFKKFDRPVFQNR